ncbi:MAG: ATP-binding protein [Anaerolineae bacterium]|jgi:signal transduction histidine kinase/CheY-like chemotaxis protein
MVTNGSALRDLSLSRQALEELRQQVLGFVLISSILLGCAILLIGDQLGWSLEVEIVGFALTIWPLVGFVLQARWPHSALTIITLGYTMIVVLGALWLDTTLIVPLVIIPVALASVFWGVIWAVAVSVGLSIWVLTLSGVPPLLPVHRLVTLILIWSTLGLVTIILRFATEAVAWSQASHERAWAFLESARDQRMQLKQAQEDLVQANAELMRVSNRLDAMRHLAEDARRVKEEFVANVSHELRTPLNMIIGFSEMIVESPESYGPNLPPALLSDLNVILRNSRHLSGLIDDILDLSQIETGRWALTKERVALSGIITSAVDAVRPLFQSKSLYLRTDVQDDLPDVFCDRTRIREVMLNLLSNAGRFTEVGGVHLRAWREASDVVVQVTDTGPGISEEQQKRLFRPFEQLDGSIRRMHGGSGLGLSISKAFVELHAGEMWLTSQPGMGTSVCFRLPIDPPVMDAPGLTRWFNVHAPFEERRLPRVVPPGSMKPRYVVIEPEETLQRVLRRYVDGVEIVVVRTLAEAVAELSRVPAQALLVNDASVSDALRRLDRSGNLPFGTPAIICSMPSIGEIAESRGIDGYLVKPILGRQMLAALDDLGIRSGTVLVIDDEPEALRLFHRILASSGRGYRVLRAGDGRQALEILQSERPDIMLLDLVMPDMDGFQVLEHRNARPDLRQMPVLVISARDPLEQPIVSNALGLIRGGGLSVGQLLSCIEALTRIVGTSDQPGDPVRPEKPIG